MGLTRKDLEVIMPLIDAGVRAVGLRLFENNGGGRLQAVLAKLQAMADADTTDDARMNVPGGDVGAN